MIESFLNMSQYPPMDKSVRVFKKSIINFKASSYHEMTPSSQWRTQPPVLKEYDNSFIRSLEQIPLRLDFECHNQNIERHVKTVLEAAAVACGHDRRDGNIRNKTKSRKLMKSFVSKNTLMHLHLSDLVTRNRMLILLCVFISEMELVRIFSTRPVNFKIVAV